MSSYDDLLRELQDPATWDDLSDEILAPVARAQAVVPVSFARDDFARLARYAREHGIGTAEFIRRAALDRLAQDDQRGAVALEASPGSRS